MELEEFEMKQTTAILGSIVKAFALVSFSVAFVFWGKSYKLTPTTIQNCQSACEASESRMESVTSRECLCEAKSEKASAQDIWVLPRGMSTGLPKK